MLPGCMRQLQVASAERRRVGLATLFKRAAQLEGKGQGKHCSAPAAIGGGRGRSGRVPSRVQSSKALAGQELYPAAKECRSSNTAVAFRAAAS